jgi:predicted ABC-type ATPase
MDSWVPHFDANPDEGGLPTEERFVAAHARCLAPVFRRREAGDAPFAQLLMGAPGSGKSALKEKGLLRESDDVVEIDADAYKLQLPEYHDLGAKGVHEESSWLARQARAAAVGRGCNLLNDAVGCSAGKYAHLIDKLRRNGYSIRLVCLHMLSVEDLVRRVQYRAEMTGRIVPEAFVREAHAKIPGVFCRLQVLADTAVLLNAARFVPVWERDGNGTHVHDDDFLVNLGTEIREALRQ